MRMRGYDNRWATAILVLLILAWLTATFCLSGCATAPAAPAVPKEVRVEVAVSCVPAELPPPPEGLLSPADVAAMGATPEAYGALAADWLTRWARAQQVEAALRHCREVGQPPPGGLIGIPVPGSWSPGGSSGVAHPHVTWETQYFRGL